jgi:hypothetical protein
MKKLFRIHAPQKIVLWLNALACQRKCSVEQLVLELLEKEAASYSKWLYVAGKMRGPRDLSSRRGFAGK